MTMAALGRGKIRCMIGSPASWWFVCSVRFVILFLFAWLKNFRHDATMERIRGILHWRWLVFVMFGSDGQLYVSFGFCDEPHIGKGAFSCARYALTESGFSPGSQREHSPRRMTRS